MATDAASLNKV